MVYEVILKVDDELEASLFEVDVPKDEYINLQNSLRGELENDFWGTLDRIIGVYK
jgi:hypothetical protein